MVPPIDRGGLTNRDPRGVTVVSSADISFRSATREYIVYIDNKSSRIKHDKFVFVYTIVGDVLYKLRGRSIRRRIG